ncbi:putative Polysaccharide export protein [Candidatus Filomicrobium marinum]|uniref:Putative Polysaccharide export protein n=1 Tax=Candidatus Filomicrobium marinum TaxID=1608628 RepID=A0A0D6JFG1_9HYPH|nr:polysaccharide biosynthesis/export family protein [Candidatus Filomicrobium marinum]CFX24816.1 putative Polysaccharide export protein [Candidatus Filomicrobium marinum]CPR19220.1 putative Polysaccharide export protein [Candidatus Filomicrobium marinum]
MYSRKYCTHCGSRSTLRARFDHFSRLSRGLSLLTTILVLGSIASPYAKAAGPPIDGTPSDAVELSGDKVSFGDNLKLLFLEQIGGVAADQDLGSLNLVERTELSGEYTVQLDGDIMLPIMGPQKIAGKTYLAAQQQLQEAYKTLFAKNARVSLTILNHEPIYILGSVAKPGTYDFSSGMTVLHAIAQAGGINIGNRSDIYDLVRENQRLELSLQKQRKLLARLDVLRAERAETKPKPSDRLVRLAGSDAEKLVAEVEHIRELAVAERKLRLSSLDTTIESAERELAAQRERITHIRSNSDSKFERANMLKDLAKRGSGNAYQYLQAKSEFSDVQERLTEVNALIAQIEDRRAQSINEKSKIETEEQINLEREIQSAEDQLVEESANASASMRILGLFDGGVSSYTEKQVTQFSILRRSVDGTHEIVGGELTELRPGDLLKVQLLARPGTAMLGRVVR